MAAPGKVVPTNLGLKFSPPKIGVQYYIDNPKASFVHEISLDHLDKWQKPNDLATQLFEQNSTFLDQSKVSVDQVEKLLVRLMEKLFPGADKENDESNTLMQTAPTTTQKESPEKSEIVDTSVPEVDQTGDNEGGDEPVGEDSEDVIDIDNEEELARRGLRKIHIEGEEEEEFLMDNEGNIYNLQGDFVGAMNDEGENE